VPQVTRFVIAPTPRLRGIVSNLVGALKRLHGQPTRRDISHLEARTPMILLVELHDRPGSLCRFLETLTHVNLARIESRPVIGHPGTAFFLLDAETDSVEVLSTAEWAAEQIQRLDAWPDTSSGWVVPMAPQTEARQ
jgi:prephenate dehydratase